MAEVSGKKVIVLYILTVQQGDGSFRFRRNGGDGSFRSTWF